MDFIFLLSFLILELISYYSTSKYNNVCDNFYDYYKPGDNENCYYDPDITMETPKLIEKYAKNVEIYNVTSEDGHILTLFRIANVNPRGVILMHHSLFVDSHIYLWQGNQSIAIKLWRIGFDVWLANQRGTTYSNKHVNMTSSNLSYWDFSFHEMGMYDVPCELKLIRNKTNNSKIIYFGHSVGAEMGLVYAALKPLEAKNYLKIMILVSTPAYLKHGTSLIYRIVPTAGTLERLVKTLHLRSPLFLLSFLRSVSRALARHYPFILYFISLSLYFFCGFTPSETDPKFFNFDGLTNLNDFSWKTLLHFGQLTHENSSFQMYDYGKCENLERYGQESPPRYPIEKITVPILLVSSYNDTLVVVEDTEYLYNQLGPEAKIYGHWKISGLNHFDYVVGLHRNEMFVDGLLDFLKHLE